MSRAASAFMVFDVESVGLHGEGFAAGFVVIDAHGKELDAGRFSCPPGGCVGSREGREWIAANCPEMTATHDGPPLVRAAFWAKWLEWKERGAMLAADCAWPVEARFLAACVDDSLPLSRGAPKLDDGPRGWEGPYPLLDVASMMFAVGLDPMAKHERLPDELPEHDPLADARQSARLLATAKLP